MYYLRGAKHFTILALIRRYIGGYCKYRTHNQWVVAVSNFYFWHTVYWLVSDRHCRIVQYAEEKSTLYMDSKVEGALWIFTTRLTKKEAYQKQGGGIMWGYYMVLIAGPVIALLWRVNISYIYNYNVSQFIVSAALQCLRQSFRCKLGVTVLYICSTLKYPSLHMDFPNSPNELHIYIYIYLGFLVLRILLPGINSITP